MTTGYPAVLLLDGRLGVVIGGGVIGERKVRSLLAAGARVRVISPDVTEGVRALAAEGLIELAGRGYEAGDLRTAAIVIAATDEPSVNQAIFDEARALGIPVNVVDDVERCTFIAPSIIRRGDLLIAISTGGTNPALAVRIRERLEEEFGPEYEEYLSVIARLKQDEQLPATQDARAAAWYRIVDSNVLDLLRDGRTEEAEARARALLREEAS